MAGSVNSWRLLRTAGAADSRRRAMGYAAVLSVVMLVTVMGLGALMTARLNLHSTTALADGAAADALARSMLELAAHRLGKDDAWRSRYANDTWTADESVGRGTFAFKLVDETDGDLTDDPADLVRVYSRATVSGATRLYSALLAPQTGSALNLLANGDIESGATGWTSLSGGNVSANSLGPHGGLLHLGVGDLLLGPIDASNAVTPYIRNNTTYYFEVWVRTGLLSPTTTVKLVVNTTATSINSAQTASWTHTNWQKMSGTLSTNFTGVVTSAYFIVEGSLLGVLGGSLQVDDALLVEGTTASGLTPLHVRPGTIRREVAP